MVCSFGTLMFISPLQMDAVGFFKSLRGMETRLCGRMSLGRDLNG